MKKCLFLSFIATHLIITSAQRMLPSRLSYLQDRKEPAFLCEDDLLVKILAHAEQTFRYELQQNLDVYNAIISEALVRAIQSHKYIHRNGIFLYDIGFVLSYVNTQVPKRIHVHYITELRGNPQIILQLPCNHFFHEPCLNGWIQESLSQKKQETCPLCRAEFRKNQTQKTTRVIDEACSICLEKLNPPSPDPVARAQQPRPKKERPPWCPYW